MPLSATKAHPPTTSNACIQIYSLSRALSLSLSLLTHSQGILPPHLLSRTPAPPHHAPPQAPAALFPHARTVHRTLTAPRQRRQRLVFGAQGVAPSPPKVHPPAHTADVKLPAAALGGIAKPVRAELTKRAQRQKFAPLCQSAPQQRVSAAGAERRLGRDRHGPGSSILRAAGCAADLRRLGARRGRARGGDAPG